MRLKYLLFSICLCFVFAVVGCGKKETKAVAINGKMISVMFVNIGSNG